MVTLYGLQSINKIFDYSEPLYGNEAENTLRGLNEHVCKIWYQLLVQ